MEPSSGAAAGVDGDVVAEVAPVRLGDLGKHVRGGEDAAHDEQVPRGQQHVADEPENAVAANLAQIHAGDPHQGEDRHQHLQLVTHVHIGRGDRGRVQLRMADLNADEQDAGGDRGRACCSSETGCGDGHLRLLTPGGTRGGRRVAVPLHGAAGLAVGPGSKGCSNGACVPNRIHPATPPYFGIRAFCPSSATVAKWRPRSYDPRGVTALLATPRRRLRAKEASDESEAKHIASPTVH